MEVRLFSEMGREESTKTMNNRQPKYILYVCGGVFVYVCMRASVCVWCVCVNDSVRTVYDAVLNRVW